MYGKTVIKSILRVAVVLSLLVSLAASAASATQIVIAVPDEIQGTDVQQVTWDQTVHQLIYEPLFHLSADTRNFVNGAASSWSMSPDNRELRFTIPQGRRFSNGEPLTAEAYKASFERYLEISPFADDFASLDTITTEGDDLIFSFKSSPAPVLISLSSVYGGAVEARDANERGPEASKSDIHTYGPFQVEEWVQGSHIRLVPNENYETFNPMVSNRGRVLIDGITIRFVPENFTRVRELLSGDADIIYNVPTERVEALKNDPNIEMHSSLQSGCSMIFLNPEIPGLDDEAVRLAIMLSINREELVTALSGAAQERYGLLSPAMIGFSQEFEDEAREKYSFDPTSAVKLLEEAGYTRGSDGIMEKDGRKLDFTFMVAFDVPTVRHMAPVIQAQLKNVGINVNIREFERQYINQAQRDKNYDMGTKHYVWGDADMLTFLFHTESRNFSFPDVDATIEAGREDLDPAVRAEAYAIAQRTIMDRLVAVPLVSEIEYTAYRTSIQGLILTPFKILYVNDLTRE